MIKYIDDDDDELENGLVQFWSEGQEGSLKALPCDWQTKDKPFWRLTTYTYIQTNNTNMQIVYTTNHLKNPVKEHRKKKQMIHRHCYMHYNFVVTLGQFDFENNLEEEISE